MRAAVFLDRDGTINVRAPSHEYITSEVDFEWLPRAAEGMAALAHAGLALVVVSNQRGVARGLMTVDVLGRIEELIQSGLREHDCAVFAFRYCLHDVDARCGCRKPRPGLILAAARDLGLDLEASWMVGDAETDVEAGRAAGCRTARVAAPGVRSDATIVGASLFEAACAILARGRNLARSARS